MVSMVKNMLEDPRMNEELEKLIAAGFLPSPSEATQESESGIEPAKKRVTRTKK